MAGGVKRDVGTDQRAGSNRYETHVENDAVEIDVHICPEADVGAVVDTNRRLDPGVVFELRVVVGVGGQEWRHWSGVAADAGGRGFIISSIGWCC